MADRVSHRQDRETERERDAVKTDTDLGKSRRQDGAATTAENQPRGSEEFRREFLRHRQLLNWAPSH
jgi:hypothetical protein